ncbi:urokinase plasminogen activator surface receptor-like isoform X1 [Alligator sinensis]|uniref:Urokinase plasminogen activator surface receptor-like isoform X1 n=1 Tax=Alligator sinensis TaxID=38654 RepID=A0A3Q0FUL9_ALLSI|nr:urokinase plasminogen activator surface receptor-like isoform X1 [Alligator sinensis]
MRAAVRTGCMLLQTCNLLPRDNAAGLTGSTFCCTTDLCTNKSYIRQPGPPEQLLCQTCVGNATTCGPDNPTVSCLSPEAQCLQLSRELLPGEQGDTVYKACGETGPAEELLAIAAGPDLTYVHAQRCRGAGCNNGSFVEVPRGKPNGKLCYSCQETGKGECNHQQVQTITCTGAMDVCVKAQSTDRNNPGTLLCGCGSPDLCRPWQPLARLLLPSDPQIHCCNVSLCNHAAPCQDPLPHLLLPLALLLLGGAWS